MRPEDENIEVNEFRRAVWRKIRRRKEAQTSLCINVFSHCNNASTLVSPSIHPPCFGISWTSMRAKHHVLLISIKPSQLIFMAMYSLYKRPHQGPLRCHHFPSSNAPDLEERANRLRTPRHAGRNLHYINLNAS